MMTIQAASPLGLVLGVIGGMGPLATAEFFRRVIQMTPANRDQAHIHILVDCNPRIPDRTAALLDQGPDPGWAIAATARTVFDAGAEVIAMPCMTAHAWLPVVSGAVPCRVLDMAAEAALAICSSGRRVVGVLATAGTIRARVLESAFARVESPPTFLLPSDSAQNDISAVIEDIKRGDFGTSVPTINRIGRELVDQECDVLLLACTELSVLRDRLDEGLPWLDALDVLAGKAVETCLGMSPKGHGSGLEE